MCLHRPSNVKIFWCWLWLIFSTGCKWLFIMFNAGKRQFNKFCEVWKVFITKDNHYIKSLMGHWCHWSRVPLGTSDQWHQWPISDFLLWLSWVINTFHTEQNLLNWRCQVKHNNDLFLTSLDYEIGLKKFINSSEICFHCLYFK